MNRSIWEKSITNNKNKKEFNFGCINCDILIIGGGITGLTLAYLLKNSNKKIVLIDKSEIGRGISSKSTAKISYLQRDIYQKLNKNFNFKVSNKYFRSQIDAIDMIKRIVRNNNIDCDLEKSDSVLFTTKETGIKKILLERNILTKFGVETFDVIDKRVKEGFYCENNYTFDPVKYLDGLYNILKDYIEIREHVIAQSIKKDNDKYRVITNRGVIMSSVVVVSCHYPFFIKPIFIPFKTYIEREYVNVCYSNNFGYNAINVDNSLCSIRFYKDKLIYNSNCHKLTSKLNYGDNYSESKENLKKNFNKDSLYTWMNQDIFSHDNLPFIGKVKNNLYITCAYSGWGMTNGTVAAMVVKNLILDGYSVYEKLFNPRRINFTLVVSSLLYMFSYFKVYIQSLFQRNNPKYVKIRKLIYGIYRDKDDCVHVIRLLCPHMKCNLIFNREDETWDCPCHGSRFDLDGKLLEGPAVVDICKK